MNDSLTQRLETATKKRATLEAQIQRVQGKLEASEAALKLVEDECRKRGIEPDQLDATITELTKRYEQEVLAFEQKIAAADAALAPYTGE